MKLYSYYRSSAAYRIRIALNLKGLPYDYVPVNLLTREQKSEAYLARNPQGLVPALELDGGEILSQSIAILEWLEETSPPPALLPQDPLLRARVRSLVNNIACDVHPLNNISVLGYLKDHMGAGEEAIQAWYRNWVDRGFKAIELSLARTMGDCCFGDRPTLADVCLIPQVYNAYRFKVPMEDYPNIRQVNQHCNSLEAFERAAPEAQPDA